MNIVGDHVAPERDNYSASGPGKENMVQRRAGDHVKDQLSGVQYGIDLSKRPILKSVAWFAAA